MRTYWHLWLLACTIVLNLQKQTYNLLQNSTFHLLFDNSSSSKNLLPMFARSLSVKSGFQCAPTVLIFPMLHIARFLFFQNIFMMYLQSTHYVQLNEIVKGKVSFHQYDHFAYRYSNA